jgi:hypothetical protein
MSSFKHSDLAFNKQKNTLYSSDSTNCLLVVFPQDKEVGA